MNFGQKIKGLLICQVDLYTVKYGNINFKMFFKGRILYLISEVSKQLADQLKCFDSRTESKQLVLADLQEFYKKLGEAELEYSKNLEKIAERFQDKLQRQKSQK